MELRAVVMFYSALLGATLPARALKQGLICFNPCRANKHSLLVHCTISECLFVSTRIETNETLFQFTRLL